MEFLPGFLRDAREWIPTSAQFANAGTVALMTLALLTVLQRIQTRMFRAEAQAAALVVRAEADAAALVVKDALQAEAVAAAELVAARLKAEADLAAARLLATAKLLEERHL